MGKTQQNYKNLIKYLLLLSKEELIKSLDRILKNKLIKKTDYKIILKEWEINQELKRKPLN